MTNRKQFLIELKALLEKHDAEIIGGTDGEWWDNCSVQFGNTDKGELDFVNERINPKSIDKVIIDHNFNHKYSKD